MNLTVYADESGVHGTKGGSPTTILGGYIAPSDQWASFEIDWRHFLSQYGLQSIHAIDLAHSKGVFREWRTVTKQGFLNEAAEVIGRHRLLGISTNFNNVDYDNFYIGKGKPKKTRLYTKYGVVLAGLMAHIADLAAASVPPVEKVNLVLAVGSPGSGDAQQVWDWLKSDDHDAGKKLGSLSFAKHEKIPGLQAADLFVYSAFKAITTMSRIAQFATMWQSFLSSPHIQHVYAFMPPKVLTALRDEAFRLEKARMDFGAASAVTNSMRTKG